MHLQEIVDELAVTLGRSVVINDLKYAPIVASAQGDDIDEVRARALLQRVTPPRERAHLESLRLTQARRPMTVDLSQFGARERLAIPIWIGEHPVGVLWLMTGGLPPLSERDFQAIDAAVAVARPLIRERDLGHPVGEHESVFAALLSPDSGVRRRAMSTAVRSHGVRRGRGSKVVAVAVGHDTGVVQRVALARTLEGTNRRRLRFLGERGAALAFLSDTSLGDVEASYFSEAADRTGVLFRSVGTAHIAPEDEDLIPVVERALSAATIAEVLPELNGSADVDDVGPWLMMSEIAAEPARLQWFSPAAHVLVHDTDPLRRQTVEAYLDGAGQIRHVCERLHIHRTTLYYRLENLPQKVKEALDDGLQRSALHMGLKLAHFWQNDGRA